MSISTIYTEIIMWVYFHEKQLCLNTVLEMTWEKVHSKSQGTGKVSRWGLILPKEKADLDKKPKHRQIVYGMRCEETSKIRDLYRQVLKLDYFCGSFCRLFFIVSWRKKETCFFEVLLKTPKCLRDRPPHLLFKW